jgi:hypothetical protein
VVELASTRQLGILNLHCENKELRILSPELPPNFACQPDFEGGQVAVMRRKGEANEKRRMFWDGWQSLLQLDNLEA